MTLRELLRDTAKKLFTVSGESAPAEARELVSFALGRRIGFSDGGIEADEGRIKTLGELVERRLAHEPLQYIIGEWDLMGLTFDVTPDVLIPRQDTETLCAAAEGFIRERGFGSLLDLCTGSGCVGISLAKRMGLGETVLADISEAALAVAAKNAKKHGVPARTVQSDLFSALGGEKFDIITVNPPYIPSSEVDKLDEEVRQEPRLALDGGEDGLDFYRRIAEEYAEHLSENGVLLTEIGFDQGESVPAIFGKNAAVRLFRDDNGKPRVVAAEPAKGGANG